MNYYKLINEGAAEVLIRQLESHLKEFHEKVRRTRDIEPLYYFEKAVHVISKYDPSSSNDDLNNFIHDEFLTLTEAYLLLNGLNPSDGKNVDFEHELRPRGGDHCSYDILHDYLYENNKEFRQLSKAVEARDGFAFEEDSNVLIYTEAFIPWAIEKGFIKEVGGTDDQNPATETYPTQQKIYNTVVVLIALKKHWEEDKSNNKEKTRVSTLLKNQNTKFYKSIKSKLASKNEQSNELPLAKTLKNYISQYNTFKDLIDKD